MALSTEQILYNESLGLIGEYQIDEGTLTTEKQYELCERFYAISRDEVLALHPWNEAVAQVMVLQDATAPLFDYAYRYLKPTDCLRVLSINEDVEDWQVQGQYVVTDHIVDAPEYDAGGIDYVTGQYVSLDSITYLCNTSHTSSSSNTLAQWGLGAVYATNQYITYANILYKSNSSHTATALNRPDVDAVTWTSQGASYFTSQVGDYGYIDLTYIKQLTTISEFSTHLRNAIVNKLAQKIVVPLYNNPKAKVDLVNEFNSLVMPQARGVDATQGRLKPITNSSWIRSRS